MKRLLLALLGSAALAVSSVHAQQTTAPPAQPDPGEEPAEEGPIRRGEEIVVSASKVETEIINAPATMSVITSDSIASAPSQNYGDLLRSVPGLNVIQMSARDVNVNSRQASGTLSASQLVVVDGRSIYLDFYGFTLWDWIPSNTEDVKQIEVVRGPASAVWGANALTGVINIITKTPREVSCSDGGAPPCRAFRLSATGGLFNRDAGSTANEDGGQSAGTQASFFTAPNQTWSFKISGGYFYSDPYPRPVGTIPVTTHPLDPNLQVGGAPYPPDREATSPGDRAFENTSTSQPKVDVRIDQELGNGGRLTYSGGYAGTDGIIHTGIGPFDIQSGSNMSYGRIGYGKGALKVNAFANFVDADAPSLLLPDPTGQPVNLTFKTQTYDFEIGHSTVLAGKHILTYGGNARRNNFDTSITPNAEDRNEFGGYFQWELFVDKFRLAAGARVDKFGNIDDAVFSPRITAIFKPAPAHAIRASYNRAFQSPSTVNNFLFQPIIGTTVDLRALTPALALVPPPVANLIRPLVVTPWPLIVNNIGNPALQEQSLDAFELAYNGTVNGRTSFGIAVYQNDTDNSINFVSLTDNPTFPGFQLYSVTDPPPGVSGAQLAAINGVLAAVGRPPLALPKNGGSYYNLGPIRNRGVELSLDHSFNNRFSASFNYSWQDDPEPLTPEPGQLPYPFTEINLPPQNRFNAALSYSGGRFLGMVSLNYADDAFWTDVLSGAYNGFTDSYTMLNATVGMKWADGKVTTSLKGTNLTNDDIQQHVFGDILKRSILAEVKFVF
jgi:outer membrane receptor protein involved in Fe transport